MAKSKENPLDDTVNRLPAESATVAEALREVVPKILAIMFACKEKIAGTIQPAVDDIVHLCMVANLASKKSIKGHNRC